MHVHRTYVVIQQLRWIQMQPTTCEGLHNPTELEERSTYRCRFVNATISPSTIRRVPIHGTEKVTQQLYEYGQHNGRPIDI